MKEYIEREQALSVMKRDDVMFSIMPLHSATDILKNIPAVALPEIMAQSWVSVEDALPVEEWRKFCNNSLSTIYPCLVTRKSRIDGERVYVAKHYFDGEDFLNNGEEVCTKYVTHWQPLPPRQPLPPPATDI